MNIEKKIGKMVADQLLGKEPDWGKLSNYPSIELIEAFPDKIEWGCISDKFYEKNEFTEDFIERFKDKLNWSRIIKFQDFPLEFWEKHIEYIRKKFFWLSDNKYGNFTTDFVMKHCEDLDVKFSDVLRWKRRLPKDYLMRELITQREKLGPHEWWTAFWYQDFSEVEVETLMEGASEEARKMIWKNALNGLHRRFSMEFIRKHMDWILQYTAKDLQKKNSENESNLWYLLSRYHHLSEDFMEEYAKLLNWKRIGSHQRMSYEFLAKHYKKWTHKMLKENWYIGDDLIRQLADNGLLRYPIVEGKKRRA